MLNMWDIWWINKLDYLHLIFFVGMIISFFVALFSYFENVYKWSKISFIIFCIFILLSVFVPTTNDILKIYNIKNNPFIIEKVDKNVPVDINKK